jgi:hypothetical protein
MHRDSVAQHSIAVRTDEEGKGGMQCESLFLLTPLVVSEHQCLMGICSGIAVLLHIKKPPCGMYDCELLVLGGSWQSFGYCYKLWNHLRPFYKLLPARVKQEVTVIDNVNALSLLMLISSSNTVLYL